MTQRGLLSLIVVLLGSVSTAHLAAAADQPRPEIEIDRSVLQDLKGYEPPPMFGAATPQARPVATPPLKRVAVAPQAPTLTNLKAEDVLEFPVKNSEVVTRQRMTAPEETVASARPDYSDSHTLLKNPQLPPAAAEKLKPVAGKKIAKAPLPPKKPALQLVAATNADKPGVDFPLQTSSKADKKPAAKPLVVAKAEPAPMKPAAAAPKYVPKSSPSMPAVPSGKVEKSSLDAFSLPPAAADADRVQKPSAGERMIDQALTGRMVDIDKADVEAAMNGGEVTSTKPVQMAALAPAVGKAVKVPLVSMEYLPRMTELQSDQRETLNNEIVSFLKKKDDARLQIQAFAAGDDNDSNARRTSLARALAVRAYLLEKGIDATRIDVRALGSNTNEKPVDRVDMLFTRQN